MRLVSYRGPQLLLAAARWCVDCRRKPLEDETVHGGSLYPKRNHGREGCVMRQNAMTHPTTRPWTTEIHRLPTGFYRMLAPS
jgi:hypothetical protein